MYCFCRSPYLTQTLVKRIIGIKYFDTIYICQIQKLSRKPKKYRNHEETGKKIL